MAVSKRDDSVLPDGPGESAQHALDEETKAWMPSFVLVACFRGMLSSKSWIQSSMLRQHSICNSIRAIGNLWNLLEEFPGRILPLAKCPCSC